MEACLSEARPKPAPGFSLASASLVLREGILEAWKHVCLRHVLKLRLGLVSKCR